MEELLRLHSHQATGCFDKNAHFLHNNNSILLDLFLYFKKYIRVTERFNELKQMEIEKMNMT